MLDVRNDYEWDAGHFQGAARPREEAFQDTPVRGERAEGSARRAAGGWGARGG